MTITTGLSAPNLALLDETSSKQVTVDEIRDAVDQISLSFAENRFKGNQNWNVAGADGSVTSTPQNFSVADSEFSAGRFVGASLINAAVVGGVFNADSGSYYLEYEGDFTDNFYGVKKVDNTISQVGCALSLVSGKTRLTVDMSLAPAHKFPGLSSEPGIWPDINDEESLSNLPDEYWIDYVDPDAIGANPTARIYADGTIDGSTDNGSYIKRPNGELEITKSGTTRATNTSDSNYYGTASGTIYYRLTVETYPHNFVGSNPSVYTAVSKNANVGEVKARDIGLTDFKSLVISPVNGDNITLSYLAKGRWK